jgi:hypothetical protein
VRHSQRSIRTSVKSSLPIQFTSEGLTSHSGLVLIERFLLESGWLERIRKVFAGREFDSDYSSWRMTLCVIALLLVGGTRIAHLSQLGCDPIFLRFVQLHTLPSARTLSRWLASLTQGYRDRLQDLLREVAYATWSAMGLARITIDVDGTVVRTGECVEGAERGFHPHHPKDPSYYPLTAQLAQPGQILGVWNRSGNNHDSVGAVGRLEELIDDARERAGGVPIEVRLDAAFCQRPVLELLAGSGVEYAVRLPMWDWLHVRDRISSRKQWKPVTKTVDAFSMNVAIPKWERSERVVVFRKRISGKPARAFQLDLFQPDDGYYEYSMVATNKLVDERTVWYFMAGRGGHEHTIGELKSGLAFASVIAQDWDANSAWQILNALTHNLVRDFQVKAGIATPKKNSRKRTTRWLFRSIRTLRFEWFHLPGRLVRPQGSRELRIAAPAAVRCRFQKVIENLAA